MRLLIACAAFPPYGRGGGPASSYLMAKSLADQGAEVRVLVVGDQDSCYQQDGMEVITTGPLNVYSDWISDNPWFMKIAWHTLENFNPRAYHRVRNELAAFQPDLLLTISIENINVASWLAAASLGIPRVHVAHSYFLMCWRGQLFRNGENCSRCGSCKLFSVGKKHLSRYVDGLITETKFIARTHIDAGYFPNASSCVVPAVLDMSLAPVRDKPRGLRVGFLGTHTPNKGIETLAAAARRLSSDLEISFLVGGTGDADYTAELRQAFPADTTRFIGWTKPEDFYPQIDVVVVPSIWREPFGRVSIEGTTFGVPALVARSGGLPENIVDGVDGFVFEPRDDETLSTLLLRLATDPVLYANMSQAARARAPLYSSERLGLETLTFLQEVATRRVSKSNPVPQSA